MKKFVTFLTVLSLAFAMEAQTNIHFTNGEVTDILSGNYAPSNYEPSVVFDDPHAIAAELTDRIDPDSLHSYLRRMSAFETRNTGSDTVSNTRGIGAARRWAHHMFEKFSTQNENRLQVSFLQFDLNICGVTQHKNVVAVLPGMQTEDDDGSQTGVIIIEGHLDSRCNTSCDTACLAEGMEDNGSGSALVMELARVMAKYQYNRTIVFMLTTGEEQGLHGADAMATYCTNNNIPVAAVLNNDVIGGVICGETSSPPSCPSENDVDSTQVRLFSWGSFNSSSKQLARYIKLQYHEELEQHVKVPQLLTVMTAEDRSGRGGDHIPFRAAGYPAMRFTSANEHGDASNGPMYDDRQHTSDDVLGIDTDADGQLDSFFVDFNYLARNAAINANAATMIAQNVCSDLSFEVEQNTWSKAEVTITGDFCGTPPYRIAYRTETNDWDTVVTVNESTAEVKIIPGFNHFFSVCRVNKGGVESLFSQEKVIQILSVNETAAKRGIELLQNKPNPFDESTMISFIVHDMPSNRAAMITISDIQGKVLEQMKTPIQLGMNEVQYDHGYGKVGTYVYNLVIDGQVIDSKKMVFVAY